MKRLALHVKILIGLFLGVVWAIVSSYLGWSQFTYNWINPFGVIFINLLKLIAVPLVLFSIIKGISDLSDISRLGNMGYKTLAMYLVTTVLAVTIGLSAVNIIRPGDYVDEEIRSVNRISYELWANQMPDVQIMDDKDFLNDPSKTKYLEEAKQILADHGENQIVQEKVQKAQSRKNESPLQILIDVVPDNVFFSLANNTFMLQIIFFALFFGITLLLIPAEMAAPVISVVAGFNEVFLKMVDIIMRGAPFFVFALLAGKISEMAGDDPHLVYQIFGGLISYSLVVVAGLTVMVLFIYPWIARMFVPGLTYRKFFRSLGKAQALAFSSSSSVATLPVTMECVNENLEVPKEVTSFVLPIGATVNMDGTSLYISIAVVFLAQFHYIDLSLVQQLTIVLTATLASIGASAVPSAGLIMMIMVLQSVGLNPAWIAIIFPVDRILDMCRTVVNVTGDATVSAVIARWTRKST